MGWNLERQWWGGYEWFVYNSAYGAAGGKARTKAEAHVEMAIAEADIFEAPYPPKLVARWRSDYAAAADELGIPI